MSLELITGRYINLGCGGTPCRVYFEEAGRGRPILCLHTAGSDTRQWRHVLNDDEFTADNRIIAFDMPWHGKSLPPEGFETQEYLLTTKTYIDTILAFCDGLGLDRPVLAGCSMGGRIALQLAALHPDRFSGFIAIEASDFQPAWYDIDWFHRPDAHGGEMGAALVSANISPHAPNAERWNTQWMYHAVWSGGFPGGSELLHPGRQPDREARADRYRQDTGAPDRRRLRSHLHARGREAHSGCDRRRDTGGHGGTRAFPDV